MVMRAGQGRHPQHDMAAEDVVLIVDRLEAVRLSVWLDGGWGVDALLGEQTRAHDDLDLVVLIEEVPAVERVLAELGYERAGGCPPMSFESVDADGRQVDSHPVALDGDGNGLYRMQNDDTWAYPAAGFAGIGVVAGRAVRCLTPEVQVMCHAGYDFDADDLHDLRLLKARFG
jgi:lincosamide nucleotidyltransferase A/C/D/E